MEWEIATFFAEAIAPWPNLRFAADRLPPLFNAVGDSRDGVPYEAKNNDAKQGKVPANSCQMSADRPYKDLTGVA